MNVQIIHFILTYLFLLRFSNFFKPKPYCFILKPNRVPLFWNQTIWFYFETKLYGFILKPNRVFLNQTVYGFIFKPNCMLLFWNNTICFYFETILYRFILKQYYMLFSCKIDSTCERIYISCEALWGSSHISYEALLFFMLKCIIRVNFTSVMLTR